MELPEDKQTIAMLFFFKLAYPDFDSLKSMENFVAFSKRPLKRSVSMSASCTGKTTRLCAL